MPDLIVTIHESWLTIDGMLPDGWRLIVHNHTGDPDFYPYMRVTGVCRYHSPAEEAMDEESEDEDGTSCFLYLEQSGSTE